MNALSQSPATQPQRSSQTLTQPKPVPLAHLYWHFLSFQQHLDEAVAAREKTGKDLQGGPALRASLQNQLGFSDADYAPIRTSSERLVPIVKALDAQAAAINASIKSLKQNGIVPSGGASPDPEKLQALHAQREVAINAEIASLTQALSPQNKAALDRFLVQFFAPKNTVRPVSSSTGQTAPAAVQQ